jgi:hypothetical protein
VDRIARYHRAVRPVAVLLVLALTGCSFLAVHGPGDRSLGQPIECTTSRAWPIADLAWAAVFLASGTAAVIEGYTRDRLRGNFEVALGTGVASLAFVVSSMVGFGRISECRDALAGP